MPQATRQTTSHHTHHKKRTIPSLILLPRPPPSMPPDPPKVKKWGKTDEKILLDHIRTGAVNIEDLSLNNIEQVRREFFSHRTSENFRRNFRDYAARLDLEESFHGARRRAAEEGKSRVCLPIIFIILLSYAYLPYIFSRPLPPPQTTTSSTTR